MNKLQRELMFSLQSHLHTLDTSASNIRLMQEFLHNFFSYTDKHKVVDTFISHTDKHKVVDTFVEILEILIKRSLEWNELKTNVIVDITKNISEEIVLGEQ